MNDLCSSHVPNQSAQPCIQADVVPCSCFLLEADFSFHWAQQCLGFSVPCDFLQSPRIHQRANIEVEKTNVPLHRTANHPASGKLLRPRQTGPVTPAIQTMELNHHRENNKNLRQRWLHTCVLMMPTPHSWVDTGIAQGRVLSPLLFNLLVNSSAADIAAVQVFAYIARHVSGSCASYIQMTWSFLRTRRRICSLGLTQLPVGYVSGDSLFGISPHKSAVMVFGPPR